MAAKLETSTGSFFLPKKAPFGEPPLVGLSSGSFSSLSVMVACLVFGFVSFVSDRGGSEGRSSAVCRQVDKTLADWKCPNFFSEGHGERERKSRSGRDAGTATRRCLLPSDSLLLGSGERGSEK